MAVGGVAELLFGVRAEQQSLENIARPGDVVLYGTAFAEATRTNPRLGAVTSEDFTSARERALEALSGAAVSARIRNAD